MTAKLIKIDKNGSKHYEEEITCPRCFGDGHYYIGLMNGNGVLSPHYGGVCYKCNGTGRFLNKWIERTPEYQAKLDARRAKRQAERQAQIEAERQERERAKQERQRKEEEERLAREARIKAQKAISQHIGEVGERMTIKGTYVKTAWFEVDSFRGFGKDTIFIHIFKDASGNVIVWKTSKGLDLCEDDTVQITGRVKEHSEYKDEKQTVLTRCKIELAE